jgi:hypothetical protein
VGITNLFKSTLNLENIQKSDLIPLIPPINWVYTFTHDNKTEINNMGSTDFLEIIAIQSFEHLNKVNSNIRISDLESEVINLSSYLILRNLGIINWKLSFLDDNIVINTMKSNVDFVEGITEVFMRIFPDEYTQNHASMAEKSIQINLQLIPTNEYSEFLKTYFITKHKIQII